MTVTSYEDTEVQTSVVSDVPRFCLVLSVSDHVLLPSFLLVPKYEITIYGDQFEKYS